MIKYFIRGKVLYLSLTNKVLSGIIFDEDEDVELDRFQYNFADRSREEAVLNFCFFYGQYRKFEVAGVNNKFLYDKMFNFFNGDEEQFKYFFHPYNKKLDATNNYLNGFDDCLATREKLNNEDDDIIYLDTVLDFGKYSGKSIQDILSFAPQYLKYLKKSGKNLSISVLKSIEYL